MKTKVLALTALAGLFSLSNVFAYGGGETAEKADKNVEVRVYDSRGVMIKTDDLQDKQLDFDLSDLPTGVYAVEIASEGNIVNQIDVMNDNGTEGIHTRIINPENEVVVSQTYAFNNSEALDFNLKNLPAGDYTLEVFVGNTMVSQRVLKN